MYQAQGSLRGSKVGEVAKVRERTPKKPHQGEGGAGCDTTEADSSTKLVT